MRSEKRTPRQIALYLAVGASTALLELLLFEGLYLFVGVDVFWANVCAVVVATAANFALNGTVTFKGASNVLRSAVLYCALFILNTLFSSSVIAVLVGWGAPEYLAKLSTMVCIVAWNYFLYRKVIFV
ncbi:GtrA family protein [Parvibacter caecicola]|uniref:Polysaccharide biosynthesis protein GtrA n=1 Tax=Parvibacter caecicola TaxID=747645 RepID=A0A4T9T8K9_9ACTN|nr:GtrA family protein [Parvibacter caecicola]TJW11344.1 polysaccharide biosynthesis protein GtrA [Parvibacter caecicola]